MQLIAELKASWAVRGNGEIEPVAIELAQYILGGFATRPRRSPGERAEDARANSEHRPM